MCGEIDEQSRIDEELFDRFLELAARHGVSPSTPSNGAPTQLTEQSVRAAYMDRLFKAGLTRALNDAANLPQGERMDVLAGQAIVFARLAGFIAGQFPAEALLVRTVVGKLVERQNVPAGVVLRPRIQLRSG